jgi:predicted GIY-YIG superfamily endonuclease
MARVPELFAELDRGSVHPLVGTTYPQSPAIYVFFEDGKALHVGRTNKLRQRIVGHRRQSHYSATFAFKETRRATENLEATYQAAGSRAALMKDPEFRAEFDKQRERLQAFGIKYLVVQDPIDQYLLELYAALEYKTSLSEFDNH